MTDNKHIFVADVDGTLTPARLPMTSEFAQFFRKFVVHNVFYVVTGSDYAKTCEQIPQDILNSLAGVYTALGNVLYKKGKLVYSRDVQISDELLSDLEYFRSTTLYPGKLYENYIENRHGMLNFSVLGRNCPYSAREKYYAWDQIHHERAKIVSILSKKYSDYDFAVGGNISIDVVKLGYGKNQVADQLHRQYPTDDIIFFGDRICEGGNDYPLALRLRELGSNKIVPVESPDDVLKFLKNYNQY